MISHGIRSGMLRLLTPAAAGCAVMLLHASLCSAENLFHNGSAGECYGCHGKKTIRASAFDGLSSSRKNTDVYILKGVDPSSTCLICHTAPDRQINPEGYYIATANTDILAGAPPSQLSPGGDFSWLKMNYRWTSQEGGGAIESTSPGDRHGHNIVAAAFGYKPDALNAISPGGNYPSEKLTCVSCHDPHGSYRRQPGGDITTGGVPAHSSGSYPESPAPDATHVVGSYRLLAGVGYAPKGISSNLAFTAPPPSAVAPQNYNRSEAISDTRVAYGRGMSEWCRNCHEGTHRGWHPVGSNVNLTPQIVKNYNSYLSSGRVPSTKDKAFTSLVTYEYGVIDYTVLKPLASVNGSNKSGPVPVNTVMCLTCHRAHASGWDFAGRWNMKTTELISDGKYPGIDNSAPSYLAQGRTATEVQKAYYDRPASVFSNKQKGLCSKCHDKE